MGVAIWFFLAVLSSAHSASASASATDFGAADASSKDKLPLSLSWKSPDFDFKGVDFAVADFIGDNSLQTAMISEKEVFLYSYPPISTSPLAAYPIENGAYRLLSVSATVGSKAGGARLFASYYDGALGRVATRVLRFSPAKKKWLSQGADIPYLTREIARPNGKSEIICEQLIDNPSFPFSAIYPLISNDGTYEPGHLALSSVPSRWIYSLAEISSASGERAFLAILPGYRLRLDRGRASRDIPGSYGQSPTRLRWPPNGSRILRLSPRIAVDSQYVFVVQNQSNWGILSEAFGSFNHGRVIGFSWDGLKLKKRQRVKFQGSVADIGIAAPSGRKELSVFWVDSSGQSRLWIYAL